MMTEVLSRRGSGSGCLPRAQVSTSDSAAVQQLHDSPGLLNVARALAFHSHLLRDTPLAPAAAVAERERVADMTEMLRTIMCL